MMSLGESKIRWIAIVISTTPRLEPKWPAFTATASTMKVRISSASVVSCSYVSSRRSAGELIVSNNMPSFTLLAAQRRSVGALGDEFGQLLQPIAGIAGQVDAAQGCSGLGYEAVDLRLRLGE